MGGWLAGDPRLGVVGWVGALPRQPAVHAAPVPSLTARPLALPALPLPLPWLTPVQGMSEEDVLAAANAAEEEAAASSDVRRAAAGAMDAQSRYYALAHRWVGWGGVGWGGVG